MRIPVLAALLMASLSLAACVSVERPAPASSTVVVPPSTTTTVICPANTVC